MSAAVPDSGLVRVTVNLTGRAQRDLDVLMESTGLGKTDVINRAIRISALVESLTGNEGLTIKRPDGTEQRIYII